MAKSSVDKSPLPLIRDFSLAQTMVYEGKAYHVANPTMLTGVTGQTSHALTLATIYIGNRGSRQMIPLWARFSQSGTVAGGRIQWGMKIADTDQFTSGTALTVEPLNADLGGGSQAVGYHTATIPAFTAGNARNLAAGELFMTVLLNNAADPLDMLPFPGCCVINPGGALYIYSNAATTGPTWQYDVAWAELEV